MLHKLLAGHRSHIRSILSIMLCLALVCGTVASMSVFAAEPQTVAETAVEETSTENTAGETTVVTETSTEAESIVSSESAGETSSEEVTETSAEEVTETPTEVVTEGVTEPISEATTENELDSEEETSAAAESSTLSLGSSVSATADEGISVTAISGLTSTVEEGSTISLTTTSRNGTWSSSNTSVATVTNSSGQNQSTTVTGVSEGTVTITYATRDGNSETYTVTVTAASATVKVYVYVSASGMSDEMLELLGIDPDTLDANGFFPAGEIELDRSYLSGKSSTAVNNYGYTAAYALINSEEDWTAVLAALSNMNTDTLTGVYAANQGNNVPDYLDQAEKDLNGYMGSGYSALFRWNETTSYGFEDQSVVYHLDLRFSTKTITFITGNNGITGGTATDGTTVDSRTYITGSIIQDPRNLNIPEGYKFAGYYTDAEMTEEWNGIGTALNENTVVYIKLVPLTDVTINYVVQVGKGTVTDPSSNGVASQTGMEHFNPETGADSIEGSTATASYGYEFDGWYSDEECTVLVSASGHYTPSTPSGGWNEGDEYTYYAKFVPVKTTVTVNKIWEDEGNTSLRPDSVTVELYADDETTSTTAEITKTNDWTYTFTDLNKYSYKDDGTVDDEIKYTVQEYEVEGYTSEVTVETDGTITVTNTLSTATVTLTKVVAGNMGVQSKEFTFSVSYTDASGIAKTVPYTLTGEEGSNTQSFEVQLGTDVTVTETQEGMYVMSATVNGATETVTNNTVTVTINENSDIVVTNTYNATPDTGVNLDSAPYIVILFGVVLLGAVALIHRRKRLL